MFNSAKFCTRLAMLFDRQFPFDASPPKPGQPVPHQPIRLLFRFRRALADVRLFNPVLPAPILGSIWKNAISL